MAELACQEIDLFHMMLVTRGKFQYGLKPELLLSLHVRGTKLHQERLAAMLSAPDVPPAPLARPLMFCRQATWTP